MSDPQQTPAPQAARAATWRRYLRFWGPRAEADVDDELAFHIEMRVRDSMATGMSELDARRAAMARLGDLAAARAECVAITSRRERRVARAQIVDAFVQDVRFALRTLGRQKGWTTVAVLTLALGIGANTAVFGVVNSLLLHPLPYPDADRLAVIYQEPTEGNTTGFPVMISPRSSVVREWRDHARSFEDIEGYTSSDRLLWGTDGTPATVHAVSILPGFPAFIGRRPLVGRAFEPADVRDGGRVAMLGEGLWRTRFGGDPRIVGSAISLDRMPYTVVGVMPASARVWRERTAADVWLPIDLRDQTLGLSLIGRLRPGVPFAVAQRELDSLDVRTRGAREQFRFTTRLAAPGAMVGFRDSLLLLWGAVGLVLLIACTNVAHLMLARTAARRRELAIRASLGAGRGRIVRQMLTEGVVLAGGGGVAGFVVGTLALRALAAVRPAALRELADVRIEPITFALTTAVAAAAGILVGLFGALHSRHDATHEALKSGAQSVSQSRGQRRLRALLVVSEMAISTVLLVGASLLGKSIVNMQRKDLGFDAAGLYALEVALPRDRIGTPAASAFIRDLTERVRRLPTVRSVSAGDAPGSMSFLIGALQVEGALPPPAGLTAFINYNQVDRAYFRTMGIRLLQGTTFTDTTEAAAQVVINAGFASKHWPGQSAIGRRIRVVFNGQGAWNTIVGVVADASTGGPSAEAGDPMLYMPRGEHAQPVLVVRAAPGANPISALRSLAIEADPTLPPPRITDATRVLADGLSRPRFTAILLAAFTGLALLLAAVGLYGVMAYGVAQRTREIGIRVALGASRRGIAQSVLSQGMLLAGVGALLGTLGARAATKAIENMLYGVSRTDVVSFALGALVLVATAVVACLVPMRRAMAVDPLVAMRAD